jgi:serine protease Do
VTSEDGVTEFTFTLTLVQTMDEMRAKMQNYFYHKRAQRPPEAQPAVVPVPPGRTFRPRAAVAFFCMLALMAGVAVVLLMGWSGTPAALDRPASVPEGTGEPWPQSASGKTTVERAPTGDGTVMEMAPLPDSAAHSYQEIYQENIDCVVSIRGIQTGGLAQGTGVILSADGYIITNAHVIEGCSAVTVLLSDEQTWNARLVGMDSETDLAVLKIEASSLKPAVFGDSDQLRVGDPALAIGNPLGESFKGTMTDGIISAINRDVMVDGYTMTLIQTTAALNSGNSGGALINAYGQVVGITNLKMQSYYDTVEGLGFAIPTTTVKKVVDELIAQGHVAGRPTIGITVSDLTAEAAERAGCVPGAQVKEVKRGSDAWEKGLQAGDIIVEANGVPVTNTADLLAAKEGLEVGDTLRLRLWRDGSYQLADVMLVEQYLLDEA